MSRPGPIETLARLLGEAMAPLADRLQHNPDEVLESVGLRLPAGALGSASQALQSAAGACGQLPAAVTALTDAVTAGDDTAMLQAAATLAQRIVQVGSAFGRLGGQLDGAIQASGLTPAQKTRLGAVAQALPERLAHLGLVDYLQDRMPALKGLLEIAGLLDDSPVPGDPADPTLPPHHLKRLRLDRLGKLVKDPLGHLSDLYHFGRPDFDGVELFTRIKAMVDAPDALAVLVTPPGLPAALDAFIFRLAVEPGANPGLRVRIRTTAERDDTVELPLNGPWKVSTSSQARFESGLEFLLDPSTGLRIEPPAANAVIALALGLVAEHDDGTPMVVIGQAAGSRLELQRFAARLGLQLNASAGSPSPTVQPSAAVELKRGKVVIDASQADGFIAFLLGGLHVESAFDLTALFDARHGLRFTGSATIEIALPVHTSLGPISIPTVYLIGGFRDGSIPIELSADVGAQLGPLAATVSRLGATAAVSFPQGGGNAGPVQIDVAFKAPNGVGLSVGAGVVTGGGFLYLDPARGEYSGALELTLAGFLSVKAIGIITTRMPDGSSGFSLLIIITAEFGTGIQLGLGFTLLGVGGLLGLNRTMRLDALVEGVRTGGINSVMFPRDVVANAPRIISDLRAFFPPKPGTFLIGPMLKLGWGTPTLVSLSVGVIVEIRGNVAAVGVLRLALPAEDIAVVVLQVSFIGAIEFDKKRGWFFASLFDSRVLFITIDGEMGLLVGLGDDADFVVSVGGFHPRYSPPPLPFGVPRRIALDIVNTSIARIRAEGYFATTTNSVQFGCHAEAFFGFSALNVSGHMEFDALIRFAPFYFIVGFSSHYEVRVFGVGVWGLRIRLEIDGPTPWHANGSAGISLLFFDIDVPVHVTWGDEHDTNVPTVKVLKALADELRKADSWRALPPPGANLLVALRKLPASDSHVALHPLGVLQVSQRFAPLDTKLDRIGAAKPEDGNRFSLAVTSPVFSKRGDVEAPFAPAQFEDLSDDDRLSRKAFEPRHAGIELGAAGAQLASAASITRVARYELTTVDTNGRRHRSVFARLASVLFEHWLGGAAVAKSVLSAKTRKTMTPVVDGVVGRAEDFVVALKKNNQSFAEQSFSSEGAARQWLADAVAADRDLTGTLHVLPGFEVAA